MAKYIIVVPPFWGHINPTLGIGRELISRGHEVLWVGIKEINTDFIPKGGNYIVPNELEKHQQEIEQILKQQVDGMNVVGDKLFEWSFELNWIPFCHFLVPGLLRTIKEFKPDLIISDQEMKAGAICANILKIPYAISIAPPPGLYCPGILAPEIEQWLHTRMISLQQEYGINSEHIIFRSPKLNLVYSSQHFITNPIFNNLPQYKFIGPIVEHRLEVTPFDWNRFNSATNKKVYVSIGTIFGEFKHRFLTKIVDAFKDQNYTVVVAGDPQLFDVWPTNFIVQDYCPQSDLIPKVDVVISHGGFNTVNETLYHGIPILIIPLAFDNLSNGYMVTNAGCGMKLRFKRLSSALLRESVAELISDPNYKTNLEKMKSSMQNLGGAKTGANLIENLLVLEKNEL